MAGCSSFSIGFSKSAEDLLAKAKIMIKNHGGSLSGETESGVFTIPFPLGTVKGKYSTSEANRTLTIKVTDKPFLLPCATIEGFVKGQINSSDTAVN